jgi:hypothetical protein
MTYVVSLYVTGERRAVEVLGNYTTRQEAEDHAKQELARVQNIPLKDRNPTFDFATRFTIALTR